MNIKRKITVLLTLISILCTTSVFSAGAPSAENTSGYGKECYSFLQAVKIIDADEAYNAELAVTRGYFVNLSLGLAVLDTGILNTAQSAVFEDVPLSHEYAPEIEAAYRLGFVAGSSEGNFDPDSPITLSQSVKIICGILGYTETAEAMGGYPYGYMSLASKLGILDDISIESDSTMKLCDVMCLLKNAAESDVMTVSSYGSTTEYIAYKDHTVLSERKGIQSVEGIVCDDGITNLKAPESEVAPDHVCIGQTVLKDENNLAGKYLGYNVKVYYDTGTSGTYGSVLYVSPSGENVVSKCSNFNSFTAENGIAEYETEENKYEKIKISPTASYIFNGKMNSMTCDKLTEIKKGSVQFLSNDGDKLTDVVIITSYETHVLSGVSNLAKTLYCEDGTVIELDENDDSYIFEIVKNGVPVSFSDISPGSVILAAISKGDGINKKKILVSDAVLSGKVTEISDNKITVDSSQYFADSQVVSRVKTGNSYSFGLDSFGSIALADSETNAVYGYLYGLKKETFGNIVCKIFTENDRWVELDFDSEIKFNGVSLPEEEVYSALGTTPDMYRGLIRYRVNNSGDIRFIETPESIKPSSPEADAAQENNVFRTSYEGSLKWRSTPKCFDSIVWVKPSTVIFSVPDDGTEDDIRLVNSTNLDGDRSYPIKAYDMDEYMNAGAVIINESISNEISYTSNFMIIKSKSTALNYDGEIAPAIRGWWNGKEFSFTLNADDENLMNTFNSLCKGDVILFSFGNKDEIVSMNRYALTKEGYYDVTSPYAVFKVAGGIADKTDFSNGHIGVVYNQSGDYFRFIYSSSVVVYVYDKSDDTCTEGDIYDIAPGDGIIVKMRYLSANEVIVLKD